MKIVVDVSSWQDTYTFEKFKLLVDNGVDAAIIRAGFFNTEDRMLKTFVGWCNVLKIPFGLYWYFYPNSVSVQGEKFIEVARNYDAKCLWSDVEEHTGSQSFLDGYYKTEFTKIKNAFPNKIVGNYSGGWVLDSYIPTLYKWAKAYPYWNAHYVKYYTWYKNYIASLGGTWDSSAKTISISNLKNIMVEIEKHPVTSAAGFDKTNLWQCITYIPFTELTEGQRHLDFNICQDLDFELLFGKTSVPPVEPPVDPMILEKAYRVDELRHMKEKVDKLFTDRIAELS